MFQTFLSQIYLNNSGQEWLAAITIFLSALIIFKIFKIIIITRLKKIVEKTKNDFDDTVIEIISNIKPPFYFLAALYLGIRNLTLSALTVKVIKIFFIVIVIYEAIKAIQNIIDYGARKIINRGRKETDETDKSTLKTINIIVKIILWTFGAILLFSNLGIDVTSLITGLGIGGIAVALAIQNILSDIFASFSILIDKPFQVGDFIKIGSDSGTVEKIGIKTTRIRTPDGQQLIIANKELTSARVQNFKRLEKRRALLKLGIVYETDKAKLEKIPGIIEKIVKNTDKTEFDRCHFKEFGDFSLNFELAYYVETQDYKEYLDVVEKINLAIFEEFGKQDIEFAYPTHLEYQKKI